MSDIVERLRLCANGIISFKSKQGDFGICDDAADEIERLREALAAVKECIEDKSYIDAEMIIDNALKGDE